MRRTRWILNIVMLCLLGLASLCMTGCRESFVIEQIIYDQQAQIVDENHTKLLENSQDSQEKDPDLERQEDDDTQKKQDDRQVASAQGSQPNPGKAVKPVADPNAAKEDKKTKHGQGAGKDEKADGSSGDSSAGRTDDPNARPVTDGSGAHVDLPEEVNTVVAASSGSAIIQMLGGSNILAGTSAGFAQDTLTANVFGGEGLGEATQLWDGDGSAPMTQSGFQQLLAMKPDVCIGVSGENSFSDAQIAALAKAGIPYVTLPRLNTDSNIRDAVTICGEVLGDRSGQVGGIDAVKLAARYREYSEDLLARVSGRTGVFTWDNLDFNNDAALHGEKYITGASTAGRYTLYLSGWDAGSYVRRDGGTEIYRDDTGVAAAPQGYSSSPLSYYLSMAGVCNNGARMKRTTSSVYAAIPFNLNVANNTIEGSSLPLYPTRNENFTRVWDINTVDVGLGQAQFPAIIVDSAATANGILGSPSWASYGRQTAPGGKTDYGPLVGTDIITSYIRDNYDVYVNPCGICPWTEGSPESVLESIWAGWQLSDAFTKNEVKNEVKSFYSTFYRYELTDAETEYILQGR